MKARGRFLSVAFVWLFAPAVAGAATYDTSAASITCTTLIGTVTSKPLLTLAPQPIVLILKGTLGGCTVGGATPADPPLQVLSGKLTARLTVTGDANCVTLTEGFQATGNLVFKWKPAAGQRLDFYTTTFTPDEGGFVPGLINVGLTDYGAFVATGTLASGSAFGGGTPTFLMVSAEDILNMLGQCCNDPAQCDPVGRGIKRLHFGLGQIQIQM